MTDGGTGDEQMDVEPLIEHDNSMPKWVWWLFGGALVVIILLVWFAIANSTDAENAPIAEPSASASASPEPSDSPTPMPSPTDVPSEEPSDSPTPMPSPTDVPSEKPSDSPTPMPSPTDVPTLPTSFGEGKITVGKDAAAGSYRTDAPVAKGCVWALKAKGTTTVRGLVADAVVGGIPTVTFADGDTFASKGCGTWSAVDPATLFTNPSAGVTAKPGVWLVGQDIRFGTWTTADLGAEPDPTKLCTWTVTESLGTNFTTVVTRDLIFSGSGKVTLVAGQQFTSTHCGEWTLLSK